MMDFGTAVKTCLSKYAVFQGRASRSEFWWFELFLLLVPLVIAILSALFMGQMMTEVMTENDGPMGQGWGMMWGVHSVGILPHLVSLALFLPTLAVTVRRLHDVGHSGWWVLILFLPVIGFLVLLFWFVQPSDPRDNAYGPSPYPYPPAA
ncbi:DUF805 domain-containing protein [Xanthobacter agilis]|uniref:Uncharacterized membrane protein YhaH (DUF805 family) n=1 Tax=Xanthobacter agilis TaxID=47492 RepID=A0ABU0LGN3_XANAG|nr:DUF805 domain-containing protein [Xanthobacter agilis]MDQ0506306.1 uncharacterized membrane protein YhaH (DUF805 family) [Xanthobacter agilis]